MRTKTLVAVLTVALFAVPFVSSAATIADLQSQIASLLSQIKMLESEASSSPISISGSGSITGTVSSPSICPIFSRSLSIGSRGGDVTQLQQFLAQQGYLNVSATGYFGALTKAALGKWQVASNVTTSANAGWGVFGPMSRSSFARFCGKNGSGGTGGATSQPFSADPQSGAAPLAVTFATNDSITASSTTYSVDFGDGSSDADMTKGSCVGITAIVGGQGGIRCSYSVEHTYTANGTYTAKLLKQTPSRCPAGMMCAESASAMMLPAPQTVATATITIGTAATSSLPNISQLNSPGSVTLGVNGIAEIRNESYYFTLIGLTPSSATIQLTPVGCWNSFPSDTPPRIRCMIAVVEIPPQTLSIGQSYASDKYGITLTNIATNQATFSITAPTTTPSSY